MKNTGITFVDFRRAAPNRLVPLLRGQSIGATDEFGWKAAEQIVTAHDFHATILYLLGVDHKRLTYFYNGRNMRLTARREMCARDRISVTRKAG